MELSATVFTIILLLILLVPAALLIGSIYEEAKQLITSFKGDTLVVPPPNAKVADWPLIGPKLFEAWKALNQNLEAAVIEYKD